MKYLNLLFVTLFLSGCATSTITYNGEIDKYNTNTQIVNHKECVYLAGPFNITKTPTIEETIKKTIKKAQDDGFYGNKLVNVKVKEGIETAIVASKQCLYIEGNLVYEEGYTLD